MVHDHKLEPAPWQKRVRRHARRRPELFESCEEETILVDAGESDLLVGGYARQVSSNSGLVCANATRLPVLRKASLPDPGAQLRRPLVEIPLSAATDLPAQQQVHRSGCAIHPRGNAHHVGQPD